MPIYRKRNNKDTWHWCQNCSLWPSSDYKEVKRKPTSGKLCYYVGQNLSNVALAVSMIAMRGEYSFQMRSGK